MLSHSHTHTHAHTHHLSAAETVLILCELLPGRQSVPVVFSTVTEGLPRESFHSMSVFLSDVNVKKQIDKQFC